MEGRHLLKVHEDVITAPSAIKQYYNDYKALGYKVEKPIFNMFIYNLEDGTKIKVYWENGRVWEEIYSYPLGYSELKSDLRSEK